MSGLTWRFDNSYARLPDAFFARLPPTPVAQPGLVLFNEALARDLGLAPEGADREELGALFAGNRIPAGAEPLAQAYAGHQFGNFTMLGDGRAIVLGEHVAPDGRRVDVQFKGSGPTPFSRRGDGRAALGPMLREYVISEAMHALGIPTTRSLAVVATGEAVYREDALPGAVLTRVAASHLRVGTFQYAAARRDREGLERLVAYACARHYPELAAAPVPALALLEAVVARQADLVVEWMRVGFVHGVMNTDNMAISGETIDYGPCAFLDSYDPETVFSSIDQFGRYAFGNQPGIAQWNLARLAEALLPLLDPDLDRAVALAEEAVLGFAERYRAGHLAMMRRKLGLLGEDAEDAALADDLLALMQAHGADYTLAFRDLTEGTQRAGALHAAPAFGEWRARWEARRRRGGDGPEASAALMQAANPVYIPRNHKVEAALAAAAVGGAGPLAELLDVVGAPYSRRAGYEDYESPAPADAGHYRTFCGT